MKGGDLFVVETSSIVCVMIDEYQTTPEMTTFRVQSD